MGRAVKGTLESRLNPLWGGKLEEEVGCLSFTGILTFKILLASEREGFEFESDQWEWL